MADSISDCGRAIFQLAGSSPGLRWHMTLSILPILFGRYHSGHLLALACRALLLAYSSLTVSESKGLWSSKSNGGLRKQSYSMMQL